MSRKKPLPLLERVTIEDVAAEGKAVARVDGMVVFTPYVVPGDVVDLQVVRKKSHYCEARAVKFHSFSSQRQEPLCPHFGVCGGCKWQCLRYEWQLHYKQKQVEAHLQHIGKIKLPPVSDILGAEHTEYYRNKIEFTFSDRRWLTQKEVDAEITYDNMNGLGFHIAGAFDKVLHIDRCLLMDDVQNVIRNGIYAFALREKIPFFDLRAQVGVLRDMIFRSSNSGELMLTLQFHCTNDQEMSQAQQVLNFVKEEFPQVTTLVWVNNLKANDTFADLPVHTAYGAGYVMELMEDLRFKVGPKSFYQTNNEQALRLYQVVRKFVEPDPNLLVYDLYTGTGTIALFLARQLKKVIGIEYVPEAIRDAEENAKINEITNTEFFAGDMKDLLTASFIAEHGRPDVIVTDPPRAGMHPDVVKVILQASPSRIVYVSCNPATQARDLALLDAKYEVKAVQPVDMFPHTHHIENVVLLTKRNAE